MACVTGDASGLVKVWSAENSTNSSLLFHSGIHTQSMSRAVMGMCWINPETTKAAVAHKNGEISVLSRVETESGWTLDSKPVRAEIPCRNGLFADTTEPDRPLLVSCSEKGVVHFRDLSKFGPSGLLASYQTLAKREDGCYSTNDPFRTGLNPTIECFAYQNQTFIVGGEKRLPELFDAETGKSIWKAITPPRDWLGISRPAWYTGMQFARPESENVVYTCTIEHTIYIYDTRDRDRSAQRFYQPKAILDSKFNVLQPLHPYRPFNIAVGDTQGKTHFLDLRDMRYQGRLHPHQPGSVRCIVKHPTQPLLVSGGLGRWLMVHSITSRKLITKIYAKQKVHSCLITSEFVFQDKFPISQEKEELPIEEVWEAIPEAPERKKKRKRKLAEGQTPGEASGTGKRLPKGPSVAETLAIMGGNSSKNAI